MVAIPASTNVHATITIQASSGGHALPPSAVSLTWTSQYEGTQFTIVKKRRPSQADREIAKVHSRWSFPPSPGTQSEGAVTCAARDRILNS